MEIFKPIKGFESLYEISSKGSVKSLKKNIILKKRFQSNKTYEIVTLCKKAKHSTFRVHRVVAETFIPNPLGLEQVNHKDCNKLNNSADNLEWCSRSDNMIHAFKNGLLDNRPKKLSREQISKIFECDKVMKRKDIAVKFNVSKAHITNILKGKRRK